MTTDNRWEVRHGDCRDIMRTLPNNSVDAIVSDPPYGLAFMGKAWDHGVPGVEFWTEALRVAKPGAHLVAFGGTRTFHRLAVAIEDAGWEVRDCLSWLYGSGFPKSHDIGKAIDKHGGTPPSWFGPWFRKWREQHGVTQKQVAALFPSKTGNLTGCVANWELGFNLPTPEQFNVIRDTFGLPFASIEAAEREVVGEKASTALAVAPGQNTDRPQVSLDITRPATDAAKQWDGWGTALKPAWEPIVLARKPLVGTVAANVTQYGTGGINVDGCRIPTEGQPRIKGGLSGVHDNTDVLGNGGLKKRVERPDDLLGRWPANVCLDEDAAALFPESRFFYTAKASRREREAGCESNGHPTIKPIALMRWLCRLVTPPDGLVLDPFNGSGSTGCAAVLEGFRYLGAELDADYVEIARKRIAHWASQTPEPDLFG
jgi:DNA modification methylase/transcriptional regulator with XRE-family HTH domain